MSIQTHIENNSKTIAIDSAATTITILTPAAGKLIWCVALYLQAEADVEIVVKSKTTAISGAVNFKAASALERFWHMGGHPIFKTLAASDSFAITTSAAVQINGWAVLAEV